MLESSNSESFMKEDKAMARAEDLSGQEFGFLKVIERAPNRITSGGQSRVRWLCECKCGNLVTVDASYLKRGVAKSCGCLQATKGKEMRNRKICVICGKEFECPPSDKTVTCSQECRKKYAAIRATGRKLSDSAKQKISNKAKGRDMTELQKLGTSAAMNSPVSGRFETNRNCKDWHLVSPGGKHYYFHSLNYWLRENCRELFGCEPDSQEFKNIRSGLAGAKRAMMGKKYPCCTHKDWQVIPTEDDE